MTKINRTKNTIMENLHHNTTSYYNFFHFVKSKNLIYAILFFIPIVGSSQSQLDDFTELALNNNVELKAQYNYYLAALEKIPQAKALPDLKVNIGAFISPVQTRTGPQMATLSVAQMLPWFGTLGAKAQAKSEIAKAQYQAYLNTKHKVLYNVNNAYNNLYILDKTKKITQENLKLLFSFKELANVKFEAGKGSFTDVLKVEMEIAALKNELDILNFSQFSLISKLETLLNTILNNPISFPDSLEMNILVMEKKVISDSILSQHPLLKQLHYEISSLEKEKIVAEKSGMPSITFGLNYINIQKRNDIDITGNGRDAFLPQVGFSIPLQRKRNKAMVKEKVLIQKAVGYEKENISNQLIISFEEKYNDYTIALANIKLNKKLYSFSQQSLNILVAEYSAANSNFDEIIKMNRQILKYSLAIEKAKTQQNTAVAYINYLVAKKQ